MPVIAPDTSTGPGVLAGPQPALAPAAPVAPAVHVHPASARGPTGSELLDQLARAEGCCIAQNVEFREMMTGFHGKNSYQLQAWRPCDPKHFKDGLGAMIGALKEESSGLSRFCLGASRGMVIHLVPTSGDRTDTIAIDKPFKCTTGCFARPTMSLSHSSMGRVAEVEYPWTLRGMQFVVKKPPNPTDIAPGAAAIPTATWAKLRASGMQWGACCGTFADFHMKINDPESGREVGYIKRRRGGWSQSINSADVFLVKFPPGVAPEVKAGIVACAAMLDFAKFEED